MGIVAEISGSVPQQNALVEFQLDAPAKFLHMFLLLECPFASAGTETLGVFGLLFAVGFALKVPKDVSLFYREEAEESVAWGLYCAMALDHLGLLGGRMKEFVAETKLEMRGCEGPI